MNPDMKKTNMMFEFFELNFILRTRLSLELGDALQLDAVKEVCKNDPELELLIEESFEKYGLTEDDQPKIIKWLNKASFA